jgi:acid phosphatase type 7
LISLLVGDDKQRQWLIKDLQDNIQPNLLSYWHHPVFSSGFHGSDDRMKWACEELYKYGCSVCITGHDHSYERFSPQDPDGNYDPYGIRHFMVGTGGKSVRDASVNLMKNSEVALADSFGVIKFTLMPESYDWLFIPTNREASWDAGICSVSRLAGLHYSPRS